MDINVLFSAKKLSGQSGSIGADNQVFDFDWKEESGCRISTGANKGNGENGGGFGKAVFLFSLFAPV
jgi:hypothetical protein